jgi:hypothetical protein
VTDGADRSWTYELKRDDLGTSRVVETSLDALADGEVRLKVSRVGLTANNVTYAVLGEAFDYWEFFPAADGWGIVPLWGFADVVESTVAGVDVGSRFYGYYPAAGHLVVRPGRVDSRGFRDASKHRENLTSPYNAYALSDTDPLYDVATEELQILFRPLYWTSFMFADWIIDNRLFGAQSVIISSASAKTAYGTAFELDRKDVRVIGLTSPGNKDFTAGLGCYDEVFTYDELDNLPADTPVMLADFTGKQSLPGTLRDHLGDALVKVAIGGMTNQQSASVGTIDDAGTETADHPVTFFAPQQMRKRFLDWGRDGITDRFAESWNAFLPVADTWVTVTVGDGPEGLENAWHDVYSGHADPAVGHIISF